MSEAKSHKSYVARRTLTTLFVLSKQKNEE